MDNDVIKKAESKSEKEYTDFYQRLRAKINKWVKDGKLDKKTGKWSDHFMQYLLVLPDLVHLMIKLFFDKKVPSHIKGYLLVGFAYLISPIDIIPDFIPVAGFIDDLLVQVVILNKVINAADTELRDTIKEHWAGDDDVFDKVQEIVSLMNDLSSQLPKALYNFIKKKE
jgi:uncharacterized membrane protein YkvA (DUF1232 family)